MDLQILIESAETGINGSYTNVSETLTLFRTLDVDAWDEYMKRASEDIEGAFVSLVKTRRDTLEWTDFFVIRLSDGSVYELTVNRLRLQYICRPRIRALSPTLEAQAGSQGPP